MEQQTRNTLPKKERLCGKTSISMLLAKGKFTSVPGMRYIFRKETGNEADRIMVSVPKKLFKRAVKRNLLKRRIRESYRKQKHNLTIEGGLDVLFTYNAKEIMTYEQIYATVGQIIERINNSGKPKKNEQDVGEN